MACSFLGGLGDHRGPFDAVRRTIPGDACRSMKDHHSPEFHGIPSVSRVPSSRCQEGNLGRATAGGCASRIGAQPATRSRITCLCGAAVPASMRSRSKSTGMGADLLRNGLADRGQEGRRGPSSAPRRRTPRSRCRRGRADLATAARASRGTRRHRFHRAEWPSAGREARAGARPDPRTRACGSSPEGPGSLATSSGLYSIPPFARPRWNPTRRSATVESSSEVRHMRDACDGPCARDLAHRLLQAPLVVHAHVVRPRTQTEGRWSRKTIGTPSGTQHIQQRHVARSAHGLDDDPGGRRGRKWTCWRKPSLGRLPNSGQSRADRTSPA